MPTTLPPDAPVSIDPTPRRIAIGAGLALSVLLHLGALAAVQGLWRSTPSATRVPVGISTQADLVGGKGATVATAGLHAAPARSGPHRSPAHPVRSTTTAPKTKPHHPAARITAENPLHSPQPTTPAPAHTLPGHIPAKAPTRASVKSATATTQPTPPATPEPRPPPAAPAAPTAQSRSSANARSPATVKAATGDRGSASTRRASAAGTDHAARPAAGNPKPDYPRIAVRRGYQGTVLLRVEVSASGAAQQVVIAHSSGYRMLDEAARKAVAHWQFRPATAAGIGINSSVDQPVVFRLEDR